MAEGSNDLTLGYMMGQSEGGGGFGMNGIVELAALGLIFGDGFGFGGGGGRGAPATQADLAAGFNNSAVLSSLNDIKLGQTNAINYNNQGFSGLNTALMQGFHGVDNALCTLGHQFSDCCCATQRAIDGVNYNMAKGFCDLGNVLNMQTRDIIDNQNANYRGLMDFLVQEKLSSKDAEIAQLQNQLGRLQQDGVLRAAIDASTAEIIRRTGHECPSPAYWVTPPTPVQVPNNGCGCGCGF